MDSAPDQRNQTHVQLLKEVDCGKLDCLACPTSGQPTVSAWFTHPEPITYRTWFICTNCRFYMHVIGFARPIHFTESRVRKDLEDRDRSILAQMEFKLPSLGSE